MNKREKESSDLQKLGERIDKKYAAKRLEVKIEHIKKKQSEFKKKMAAYLLSIGVTGVVITSLL